MVLHISIDSLVADQNATADGRRQLKKLLTAHIALARMDAGQRQARVERSGNSRWTPIKKKWVAALGKKCWYTEVELVGAHLTIDHFRPKRQYWWLAYDIQNFRVACPFSNSKTANPLYGCAGGKKDLFPLLGRGLKARGRNCLRCEEPVILDPCNPKDCELVAYQADGRPVLNPMYAKDSRAAFRLEESKVLLNLDHPDFNAKREQLYHEISKDVNAYNELPEDAMARRSIYEALKSRIRSDAPFSVAARYYFAMHREHAWVERLLKKS